MNILIAYHANCMAGIGAAMLAYHILHKEFTVATTTIQYRQNWYTDELPTITSADKVLFVDFFPSLEIIRKLNDRGIEPIILDHHKSAVTDIIPLIEPADRLHYIVADNTLSGASLVKKVGHHLSSFFTDTKIRSNRDPENTKELPVLATNVNAASYFDEWSDDSYAETFAVIVAARDLWQKDKPQFEWACQLDAYFKVNGLIKKDIRYIYNDLPSIAQKLHSSSLGEVYSAVKSLTAIALKSSLKSEAIGFLETTNPDSSVPRLLNIRIVVGYSIPQFASLFGDMAGIYGYEEDGFIALAIQPMAESGTELLSFRSSPNIDLTKMVKELFNGGGHPNACGARSDTPLSPHEYLQRISNYITNR